MGQKTKIIFFIVFMMFMDLVVYEGQLTTKLQHKFRQVEEFCSEPEYDYMSFYNKFFNAKLVKHVELLIYSLNFSLSFKNIKEHKIVFIHLNIVLLGLVCRTINVLKVLNGHNSFLKLPI